MVDLLDQLEAFIREQRGAAASEEDREWRTRLEQKIDSLQTQAPEKSRREVLEELAGDDELMAELERELAAEADALPASEETDEADGDGDAGDESESDQHEPQGIRWRRVELEVPRIYSGDDEPEHVEYLDEDGEVKVRAGRRRGAPVSEEWVEVEPAADGEGDTDDESEESNE